MTRLLRTKSDQQPSWQCARAAWTGSRSGAAENAARPGPRRSSLSGMSGMNRTWRDADGERIEGSWRQVFTRSGDQYTLTDLVVYADAMVQCKRLMTITELCWSLASGRIVTEVPEGALVVAHDLSSWRVAEPHCTISPEELLGEINDKIAVLNGGDTSVDRCYALVETYLAERTEENREALRAAYEAIPGHYRSFALGDFDAGDQPLRVLLAGPGNQYGDDETVTAESYQQALDYFAERAAEEREREADQPPDDAAAASIELPDIRFVRGWPEEPGILVLRNEFPAEITVAGQSYPTVAHAYWSLAVADDAARGAVQRADTPDAAQTAAEAAGLRPGWPALRAAVMTRLLRAKFEQHPRMAETLAGTGQTRLLYLQDPSRFWGSSGLSGRNWTGRLLELVRSELVLAGSGLDL